MGYLRRYLRLSGLLGCFARSAVAIGLAVALVGGGVLMVSDHPQVAAGPLELAAFAFWFAIGSFTATIEGRIPQETRYDPPELLAREYATQPSRMKMLLVSYQAYQLVATVLTIVLVKLWLDQVATYAAYEGWQ